MITELTTTIPDPVPTADPRPDEPPVQDQDPEHDRTDVSQPKFRLHAQELRHSSTSEFFILIPDLTSVLDTALQDIVKYLYTQPVTPKPGTTTGKSRSPFFFPSIPSTRSVTVFLRDFSGVAYTTGTELDDDHKEIHLSLGYIQHCTSKEQSAKADPLHELRGVLTHELVHCYQHTSPDKGNQKTPSPPGGLIEGIADFVRLKAGLEPPHWTKPSTSSERAKNWDAGYQSTAFFLAWIEDVWVGSPGAIGMLNDRLLRVGYVGEDHDADKGKPTEHFWRGLFGATVAQLWDEYGKWLDGCGCSHDEKAGGQ